MQFYSQASDFVAVHHPLYVPIGLRTGDTFTQHARQLQITIETGSWQFLVTIAIRVFLPSTHCGNNPSDISNQYGPNRYGTQHTQQGL